MCKFNKHDADVNVAVWGESFKGTAPPALTREESVMRQKLLDRSMSTVRANIIYNRIMSDQPFYSRVEFIEAMAALVVLFPAEVERKVTGSNKPVYKVLWCAAAPDRMEWLLNNIRMRQTVSPAFLSLLPSGSTSNEALHAEINSWFRQIQKIHKSTLEFKLNVLTLGKLVAHSCAMYHATSRQVVPAVVLMRSMQNNVWTKGEWKKWCKQLSCAHGKGKPYLAVQKQKESEIKVLRTWVHKRPAAAHNLVSQGVRHKKRTPFSLQRQGRLLSGGVKNTVSRKPAGKK